MKKNRPIEKGTFYARHWLTIFDGGSDQWLYAARDGPYTFVFIEIIDLHGYCGRDANCRWNVSVGVVNLLDIEPSEILEALDSCGIPLPEKIIDLLKTDESRLSTAEACYSYGLKAPVWDQSGGKVTFDNYGNVNESYDENCPAFRKLRKEAREFCEKELFNEESRNAILDTKIVNALGQTAREFSHGTEGLWSALRSIKERDDSTDAQKLVLKMYQNAKQTLGAGPVPPDILNAEVGKA